MNKIIDAINELQKLSKYAEILECPDEFFVHMQGHRTELSLSLCAFDIANISKDIIQELEKQIPKKPIHDGYMGFDSYECPTCKVEVNKSYCPSCGQKLDWKR